MKIYWAGIWTKSRMIPSSIPSKQMKFSYWNKRKLKLGMTMNEMNDIRDMSHSKSERKQKRPILKLFINKFSPISLQMGKFPPPLWSNCYFTPACQTCNKTLLWTTGESSGVGSSPGLEGGEFCGDKCWTRPLESSSSGAWVRPERGWATITDGRGAEGGVRCDDIESFFCLFFATFPGLGVGI